MQRERDLYRSDDLVAVYDPDDEEYQFFVCRITENIKKSDPGNKLVSAIQYNRDSEDPQDYHSTTQETNVEVSRILRKIIKISEVAYEDDDGIERTIITISKTLLNAIEKMTAQLMATSSEEEEASNQEEKPSLAKRKPKGRGKKKEQQSDSNESESRELQAPQKPDSLVQVERVLAVLPVKPPRAKVERQPSDPNASKVVGESQEMGEKTAKAPRVPRQPADPNAPKTPKTPKGKKISEYKRGKFNTRVKVDDHDPATDDMSVEFRSDCCDICSNREVVRAAKTGNIELLRTIIANKHKITSLLQPWGTDDEIDAFMAAVIRNDEQIVLALLDQLVPKSTNFQGQNTLLGAANVQYKTPDEFGLETIETGHNDEYAYGVATRQVALGRGNKEGINAMSADFTSSNDSRFHNTIANDNSSYKSESGQSKFWSALVRYASVELFKKIISITNWEYKKYFAFAVRAGNVELAAWISEQMYRSDGWGLNELHTKSLSAKEPKDLGIIRSVNTKKKTLGNYLVMPIFCAAINPNFDVFKTVHDNLEDNFLRDEQNSSLIFYAALNKNPKILEYLLERGVEFKEANKVKMTPLLVAAQVGRHENVELLLKKGDITKKKNRDGYAAVHLAAACNSVETLEVLSRFNADLNQAGPKGMSALAVAASKGHFESVEFLLQRDAKTIKKDKFKRTPLIVALKNCHARVASALVAAGCPVDEPDSSDNYPIHYACAYGCAHSIAMLIQAGANPNVLSSWKLSPIAAAMMKNHYLILNQLLEYPDIDVNCKDDSGKTLLANSVRTLTEKTVKFAGLLIKKHHADVLIPDLNGNIALHHLYNTANLAFNNIVGGLYLSVLRNPTHVEQDYRQKLDWFIELADLLSKSSLSTYCLENKNKETALERYFQSSAITSFNVLALIPQTQKYVNGRYESDYQDLHSYLGGALQVIKSKSLFIHKVLHHLKQLVAALPLVAEVSQVSVMVNELDTEVGEDLSQDGNVLQDFRMKNSRILDLYTSNFSTQYFSSYLRPALQMQNNQTVSLTLQELEYAKEVMVTMKENFITLVKVMITELGFLQTRSKKSSSASVKSCLLNFFSDMWTNLFVVPEDPSNTMNLLQNRGQVPNPQMQTQSNMFGGGGGFSFGQPQASLFQARPAMFGGAQNSAYSSFNQPNSTFINMESTGVNKPTYQKMKDFRNFQISEREKLTHQFLQMITGESASTSANDWEEQYNFCSNIIQAVPRIFFLTTVTVLDLNTFNDPSFVKNSCEQMLKSIYSLGKTLIELADFGGVEQKAAVAGTKASLVGQLIGRLEGVWTGLSAYKDVSGNNTGAQIAMMEINYRAQFIDWIIGKLEAAHTGHSASTQAVATMMKQKEESSNSVDRQQLQINRLTYQRSIKILFKEIINQYYLKVCINFGNLTTIGETTINVEEHQKVLRTVFESAIRLFEWSGKALETGYVPYAKRVLMQAATTFIKEFYTSVPTIQSQIEAEGSLDKRAQLKKEIEERTAGLLSMMWNLRDKLFSVIREILLRSVGQVAIHNDIYASDYKEAAVLISKKQVGNPRWNILSTVFSYSLDQNLSKIRSILHRQQAYTLSLNSADAQTNQEILSYQKREIESGLGLLNTVLESKLLTEHKLDRFSLAETLVSYSINMNDMLEIPAPISSTINLNELYQLQFNTRIQIAHSLTRLLKQIYTDSFDRHAQVPQFVVSALDRTTIDKTTGAQVKITRDLEEYLQEVNFLPLERFLEELTYENIHNTLGALRHQNYVYDEAELTRYETARLEYLEQLFSCCLEFSGFDSSHSRSLLNSTKVLRLPAAIASLLKFSGNTAVVSDKQVAELNNSQQYEQAIEKMVTLRSSFLRRLSHLTIRCFNLQYSMSSGDSLLEKMFSLYTQFGWNTKIRSLLREIFADFFSVYGTIAISLPNVKHPFFYLATHSYFDYESWRKLQRVDVDFYDSLLRLAANLNIKHTYTTTLNEETVETLFSEGFKSRNTNFLLALLSNPGFEQAELFSAQHKSALHQIHEFMTIPEDIEFLRLYFSKVSLDELIVESHRIGFTPFLTFVHHVANNSRGSTVYRDPLLVNQVLDIFKLHGARLNAEFDDPKGMESLKNGQMFPFKDLQKKNALQLLLAGNYTDVEIWKHLIQQLKVEVNHQDANGDTLLHLLLRTKPKDKNLLQTLLAANIDPNIRNAKAETPIFEAIRNQDYNTVEMLHRSGANLDVLNKEEMSPLTLTIKMRNVSGLEHLIKLGANLDLKDNFNRNSLHWAINFSDAGANSSFEIEEILIRGGVQVNSKDLLNRTPLHYPFVKIENFVVDSNIDPIESINSLMMNKELRVNEQDLFGNTPLHYAAQRGSLVSCLYLLDKGADVNVKNIEGHNPFCVAAIHKHNHLAVTLLSKNCEWNLKLKIYSFKKRQDVYKKVLEHLAGLGQTTVDTNVMQSFILNELQTENTEAAKQDAKYNQVQELSVFQWAIRNNWQGLAYMLLSKGFEIGEAVFTSIQEQKFNYTFTLLTRSEETKPYLFVNEKGDTIVHLICLKAEEVETDLLNKIFRVLLKKGLGLDQTNKLGHNSMHCAAICGSITMISLLLERGVSPHTKDSEGRTPMMIATQHHNLEALKKFFEMTQNHQEVDKEGMTIIHHLCKMHQRYDDDTILAALKLFSSKVDIESRDKNGKTPLFYMLEAPRFAKSLSYLLTGSKDLDTPDQKGQTVFARALKHGASWDFISTMVKKIRKVNTTDSHGRTPLGLLVSSSSYSSSSVVWLIDDLASRLQLDTNLTCSFPLGKDSQQKPIFKKLTVIDYLFRRSNPDLEVVATLLKHSAKLDQPYDDGLSSLHAAIVHSKTPLNILYTVLKEPSIKSIELQNFSVKLTQNSHQSYIGKEVTGICWLINEGISEKALQMVIMQGVDIYKQDAQGISPISFTFSEKSFKLAMSMLEGQALSKLPLHLDINVPEYGQLFESSQRLTSPLTYAIEHRQTDLASVLVKSGASLNYSPYPDRPPAYYATKYWASSTSFVSFVRGFVPDDEFEVKRVGLKNLPTPNFNFKIALDLQTAPNVKESVLVDPIYFAVFHRIPHINIQEMLNRYCNLNFIDPINKHSAFSLALETYTEAALNILKSAAGQSAHCIARKSLLDKEDHRTPEQKSIQLNQPYLVAYNSEEQKLPLNQLYRVSKQNIKPVCTAIELGADPNLQEGEKRHNLIMLAVLNNDLELIKEIDQLVTQGKCCRLNPELTDTAGKSVIHLVVNPHKNGSYENVEMLKILAKHYPLDMKDSSKFPPTYYASLQDSGVMLDALVKLGAHEFQLPFGFRRAPTSLISFATFPHQTPEYEEDADQFLKLKEEEAKRALADKPQSIPIDFAVAQKVRATSEVALDSAGRPFDTYMTKVDIKKGLYGGTVFYRMQLLHETNRDVYLVFTRYGRIGDTGQHQITSFAKKEDAVTEFCKIYSSKSNNEWGDPAAFIRHKKKYKLVRFNNTNETEHIEDFFATRLESTYPPSSISSAVKEVFRAVVDSKILFAQTKELKVDLSKLPLSKLNKTDLMQALTLLFEARKLATDLATERRKDVLLQEPEKIFELLDDLAEITSEYYELIPSTTYVRTAPPPFESEYDINSNIMKVRQLLEVEVAVKILLGARNNLNRIDPIEYCYNCLNIKMLELDSSSAEKSAIMEYIGKSHSFHNSAKVNIFALERKGEIERFAPFAHSKNRKLLWHGSRTMNFLGILNKGLRIAPPEAPSTGEMFGKGIYFADTFSKSFAYTGSGKSSISLVLLCEVALGKCQELVHSKPNANILEPGYESVMGVGRTTPDPHKDIVIPNGMVLPLGDMITRSDPQKLLALNYNEYVVYNEERVKIRYLVAVKE